VKPVYISADNDDVVAITDAVQSGDQDAIRRLLAARPELATARFGDEDGMSRTILHAATDFPGHFPKVATTIDLLIEAGADVDAPFAGPHTETALHWAASSDDVDAIDALLAAGADKEAPGGVLTGGPPLDDAVIFSQLLAARRLVEAGAQSKLFHAAALDLTSRIDELLADDELPGADEITNALWHACRNGCVAAARRLLAAGGDPRWNGWDDLTPVDAARANGDPTLIEIMEAAARR
jgi:uncharacterized protein